jgi:hypothetical protein
VNVPRLLLALIMTTSAHVGSTALEAGAMSETLVVTIQGFRSVAVTLGSRCSTATQVFRTMNRPHIEKS